MPRETGPEPVPTFGRAGAAWLRSLRVTNRAYETRKLYVGGINRFHLFLVQRGWSTEPADVTREQIEIFLDDLLQKRSSWTADARYRALRAFFGWLVAEGEIETSPLAKVRPPKVRAEPPAVPAADEIKQVLAACEGRRWTDRRDAALVRLLADTGIRRGEAAGMRVDDVNLDAGLIVVDGKTGQRFVPIGGKVVQALDRYLRVREKQRHAASEWLWIGIHGPLSTAGIYHVLKARFRRAGLDLKPHQFRHYFADSFLSAGGQEGDLAEIGGWKSREVMARYAKSTAVRRAVAAHRKFSPGDRLP